MANPKTVGQFYVETTRRAAKNSASAQDAFARYMDELAGIGSAYVAVWGSTQKTSMQTAFQLQNAAIESTQVLWDAAARANLSLFDEWAKAVAASQVATARLAAAGLSMLDGSVPSRKV